MGNRWSIVHDCNDENGKATCWSREVNSPRYGRFVWIEENEDGRFDVTVDGGMLMTCKSLTSAKRWVAMNLIFKINNSKASVTRRVVAGAFSVIKKIFS